MNIGSKTLIEKQPSLSDLRYKAKRILRWVCLTCLLSGASVFNLPILSLFSLKPSFDAQIRYFCYQGFSKAAKGCKEYLYSSDVISSALVWNFLLTRFKCKPTTLPKVRVQNVHF